MNVKSKDCFVCLTLTAVNKTAFTEFIALIYMKLVGKVDIKESITELLGDAENVFECLNFGECLSPG